MRPSPSICPAYPVGQVDDDSGSRRAIGFAEDSDGYGRCDRIRRALAANESRCYEVEGKDSGQKYCMTMTTAFRADRQSQSRTSSQSCAQAIQRRLAHPNAATP